MKLPALQNFNGRIHLVLALLFSVSITPASATLLFSDNFDAGASSAWGNERGQWRDTDGVYDATYPATGSGATYSGVTTLTSLTDFSVEVDVNALDDGGVWLRSDYNGGNINGILLLTGGFSGTANSLYWHVVQNGVISGAINQVYQSGLQDSNAHIRIDVSGNTYQAFLNGSATPLTTLVNASFSSGSVGLYDFSPVSGASSPRGQTFDNFQVFDDSVATPEPATIALLGLGLAGLGFARFNINRQ